MRENSSSFYSRGTSVLAALVVAAVLGSVGLLVQETSPIALTQAGQAAAGGATTVDSQTPSTNTPQDPKTESVAPCAGHEGKDAAIYPSSTGQPIVKWKPICPRISEIPDSAIAMFDKPFSYPELPTANLWGSNNGRCVGPISRSGLTSAQPSKTWKCIYKLCDIDPVSKNEICKMYTYEKKQGVVSQGAGGSAPATGASPDGSETKPEGGVTNDTKQDSGAQDALDKALAEESKINQQLGHDQLLMSALESEYKDAGCLSHPNTEFCVSIKNGMQAKQESAAEMENRLRQLADAQDTIEGNGSWGPKGEKTQAALCIQSPILCDKVAGPGSGQKPPGDGPGNPDPTGCNGNVACLQMYRENQAIRDAMNRAQTGFGNPGGQGGQRSGGGGSGSGGQQQCQPRYVCNGNSVMYVPCTNGGQGSAQMVQQCPTGYACSAAAGSSNSSCQIQAQYGYCADGRTPRTGPAQQQPPASTCTSGTWQDTSNGCQTNWQCVSGTGQPTAQLSCQPTSATAGMTISLSYACANGATTASTTGFTVPAGSLSGTGSAVVQKPVIGNTVTYGLSCMSAAATSSAQCQVRVAGTSIVLIATPEKIQKSETEELKRKSTIGWVTTGMQSCVISSTDLPTWSDSQASITSVAGAVTTPAIDADTTFKLTCQTFGGTEASSTVKVLAI